MTLTTHAVAGAAIATLFPQEPLLGFVAAYASHYLLDAIPHWDYSLRSGFINPKVASDFKMDDALMSDMFSVGTDGVLGLLLPLALFIPLGDGWLILLGAVAGMLPDALQFVYGHFKREPLLSLQRFHHWTHTPYRLKQHVTLGVLSQLAILMAVVALRYAM